MGTGRNATKHDRSGSQNARRRRLSDRESLGRLMAAGRRLLEERGLAVDIGRLPFEEVIQHADIARSAAYRLYPRKEDFYIDLLYELVGSEWPGKATLDALAMRDAAQIIIANSQKLERSSGRRWILEEVVRQVVPSHLESVTQSVQWRSFVALRAMLSSLEEGDAKSELVSRLRDSEARITSEMAEFCELVGSLLGCRLKPSSGGDYSVLVAVGAASVEGLALRHILESEIQESRFPVTDGESTPWSLSAITFMTAVDTFLEEDPNYDLDQAQKLLKAVEAFLQTEGPENPSSPHADNTSYAHHES